MTAYLLFSLNACVNPLVYAITIPTFKKFLNRLLGGHSIRAEGRRLEQEFNSTAKTTMSETPTMMKRITQTFRRPSEIV